MEPPLVLGLRTRKFRFLRLTTRLSSKMLNIEREGLIIAKYRVEVYLRYIMPWLYIKHIGP